MKRMHARGGGGVWNIGVLLLLMFICMGCMPIASQPQQKGSLRVQQISTSIRTTDSKRHSELNALFHAAAIDPDRFARHDSIRVRWPADLDIESAIVIRIQTESGRIYLEKNFNVERGALADLGKAYLIPAGEYNVVLMPTLGEYYLHDVRIVRKVPITLLP